MSPNRGSPWEPFWHMPHARIIPSPHLVLSSLKLRHTLHAVPRQSRGSKPARRSTGCRVGVRFDCREPWKVARIRRLNGELVRQPIGDRRGRGMGERAVERGEEMRLFWRDAFARGCGWIRWRDWRGTRRQRAHLFIFVERSGGARRQSALLFLLVEWSGGARCSGGRTEQCMALGDDLAQLTQLKLLSAKFLLERLVLTLELCQRA
mmetsp:Transcript_1859/g.4173  ORF Transcript_1859/g.4173 Transcript_1859/m.4173 type:complete len:207 (+) Transcript_1859:203-823(+)